MTHHRFPTLCTSPTHLQEPSCMRETWSKSHFSKRRQLAPACVIACHSNVTAEFHGSESFAHIFRLSRAGSSRPACGCFYRHLQVAQFWGAHDRNMQKGTPAPPRMVSHSKCESREQRKWKRRIGWTCFCVKTDFTSQIQNCDGTETTTKSLLRGKTQEMLLNLSSSLCAGRNIAKRSTGGTHNTSLWIATTRQRTRFCSNHKPKEGRTLTCACVTHLWTQKVTNLSTSNAVFHEEPPIHDRVSYNGPSWSEQL